MAPRGTRAVRLSFEELEPRVVPAYFSYGESVIYVRTLNGNSMVSDIGLVNNEFYLNAETSDQSLTYRVPGQWQATQSSPNPFQEVSGPTMAENCLLTQFFPGMSFDWDQTPLAPGTLVTADAEALGPREMPPAVAAANPLCGQSLFLLYYPSGVDPAAPTIHWLQFVTTNDPPLGNKPVSLS
jgi:hypothetical protein